jgi:hypothetical protein
MVTDDEKMESPALRTHMIALRSRRSPRLLLDHSLSDYFEENLPVRMKKGLDLALPPNMDGTYLFDTNLFVSSLIEKAGADASEKSLGSILDASAIDEPSDTTIVVQGFLRFPTVDDRPDRFSAKDVAFKNAMLWKRIGREDQYRSVPTASSPKEDVDSEADLMKKSDVKYLGTRVADAFRQSSNIYEVLHCLFPDLDPKVFGDPEVLFSVGPRLEKLTALSAFLLPEDKELKEVLILFFQILNKGSFSIWSQRVAKLQNLTPFESLKRKSNRVISELNEKGSDPSEKMSAYESQWNFLNHPAEQAWSPQSPSYYSRIGRLSGWRIRQRNLRLHMVSHILSSMGWNYRDHVLDEQSSDWWMTLERSATNDETKTHLTLPFLTVQGKVLVCRFPELRR